jgi:hypothetical protein
MFTTYIFVVYLTLSSILRSIPGPRVSCSYDGTMESYSVVWFGWYIYTYIHIIGTLRERESPDWAAPAHRNTCMILHINVDPGHPA